MSPTNHAAQTIKTTLMCATAALALTACGGGGSSNNNNGGGGGGGIVSANPFEGSWKADFTGDDTGSCPTITVAKDGGLSGNCTTVRGQSFAVTGSVASNGAATFGNTTTGAQFKGAFSGNSASGTWESTKVKTSAGVFYKGNWTGSKK